MNRSDHPHTISCCQDYRRVPIIPYHHFRLHVACAKAISKDYQGPYPQSQLSPQLIRKHLLMFCPLEFDLRNGVTGIISLHFFQYKQHDRLTPDPTPILGRAGQLLQRKCELGMGLEDMRDHRSLLDGGLLLVLLGGLLNLCKQLDRHSHNQ